jgi:glutamate racemase
VVRIAAPALRDFVEHDFFSAPPEKRERVIEDTVAAVRRAGTDVLVLACTHYLHVDAALRERLGEAVRIIDSREGVVNQLERVLDRFGLRASGEMGESVMCLTGVEEVEERYRLFAEHADLKMAGILG